MWLLGKTGNRLESSEVISGHSQVCSIWKRTRKAAWMRVCPFKGETASRERPAPTRPACRLLID